MSTAVRHERRFSERGPVAKSYRGYLARASLLMFATVVIGAYLLPLL